MSTHYNLEVQNVWSDWLISKQLCRHLIAQRLYSFAVSQLTTPKNKSFPYK